MKRTIIFIASLVFILNSNIGQIQKDSVLKPRKIILLIGDGMGVAQIYAAITASRESLNIEHLPVIGFSKTYSAYNYITDSGAGATALSCGIKTQNKYIGVDTSGKAVKSILEYAESYGLSSGLVATSSITHATPASFIAHQSNRKADEDIAKDFLKTDIDVFIGGGSTYFENRVDKKNLLDTLRKRNYQVTKSIQEVELVKSGKLAGFTAKEHNLRYSEGRGDMLSKATKSALRLLNNNEKGFFLMIEGSMIDWGGHAKNLNYVIEELTDFDKAIGIALDFAKADGNTLVIVTADHETGGLSLIGGDIKKGNVIGSFAVTDHTAIMVPVFAFGPGSESFAGIYQNTAIFEKMMRFYGFQK